MNSPILLFLVLGAASASPAQTGPIKAFVGGRLINGTGAPPMEHSVILVRNGRITAVGSASQVKLPAGAERIDLAGRTVIPGFINTHGHVGQTRGLDSRPEVYTRENIADQLALYARYGVTSVVSLGGDTELGRSFRDAQVTASLDRARLFFAGPVVASDTPEAAREMVRRVAALRADVVKIRVDDNLGTTAKMTPAVYQAVIEEAHRQRLRVAAHLFYLEDARGLLEAGVDFIAHSVRDREVDAELIALFKEKDVCQCPTLTREVSAFAYEGTPDFLKDPFLLREADPKVVAQLQDPERQRSVRNAAAYRRALEVASTNLKRLKDGGVRIAFGTDTGPAGRFQGYFEHLEMELMAKAGLAPREILVAATGDAARCTGLSEQLGTVEPGKWADFVVLTADPLADIKNTRSVESVWIAGNRVPGRAKPVTN